MTMTVCHLLIYSSNVQLVYHVIYLPSYQHSWQNSTYMPNYLLSSWARRVMKHTCDLYHVPLFGWLRWVSLKGGLCLKKRHSNSRVTTFYRAPSFHIQERKIWTHHLCSRLQGLWAVWYAGIKAEVGSKPTSSQIRNYFYFCKVCFHSTFSLCIILGK